MTKAELMELEGMNEELAKAVLNLSKSDLDGMVPRSRLNEVIAERDAARDEKSAVLKQMDDLKKATGDTDAMKAQIEQLQNAAKDAQKAHESELKRMKVDNAVDMALINAKALNSKAVKALLNDLDKAELMKDGTVKGLAEQIAALQTAEDSKFLFGSAKPNMKGAEAGESGNEDGDHRVDVTKMTYSEMLAYKAEHPDANLDY